MTYAEWALEVAPPWLVSGPNGRAFLQGLAAPLDDDFERAKLAAKADLPSVAPEDALPLIGDELGLPRGPGESTESYRARLLGAFDAWTWAGTPYGMLMQFRAAGYPTVYLQAQGPGKQYGLAPVLTGDPSADLVISEMADPVHLGGLPAELWSDFGVVIAQPWPAWWSGAPADGSQDADFVRQLILKWKPAYCRCVHVTVVAGPTWGFDMTWGSFIWGGGTNTVWTPPVG